MPLYEFRCEQCSKAFEVAMTFHEREQGAPACPQCRSASRVHQQLSTFTPVTARKT